MLKNEIVATLARIDPNDWHNEKYFLRKKKAELEKMLPSYLEYEAAKKAGTAIDIRSAIISRYEGMDAFVTPDGAVYIGKRENYRYRWNCDAEYYGPACYDNSDGSFIKVSDNGKDYFFLYGDCVLSLADAIGKGVYTAERLERFAELQSGVLAQFTEAEPFTFDGVPFTAELLEEYKRETAAAEKLLFGAAA